MMQQLSSSFSSSLELEVSLRSCTSSAIALNLESGEEKSSVVVVPVMFARCFLVFERFEFNTYRSTMMMYLALSL